MYGFFLQFTSMVGLQKGERPWEGCIKATPFLGGWYLSWADHCGRLYAYNRMYIYSLYIFFKSCKNDVRVRIYIQCIYHMFIYSDHTYIYIVFDIIYRYILHGLHMSCIHWTCCTHMHVIRIDVHILLKSIVYSLHINLFIELFFFLTWCFALELCGKNHPKMICQVTYEEWAEFAQDVKVPNA